MAAITLKMYFKNTFLTEHRLSSCGARAKLLHSMWDLPKPGLKPMSLALAGRFSTTAPPGKPTSIQRSLRIWSLCSTTREAAIVRGPRTAIKSGPHLPQLEKALAQKRRPNTAINK